MIRPLVLAAALSLAAVATPALAQTPPPAAPAPTPAPRFSIDTTMAELTADPQARVVVGAFFERRRIAAGDPPMSEEEAAGIGEMIGGLTPRQLAEFPQAKLDDEALAELNAELAAIPPAPPAAAAN